MESKDYSGFTIRVKGEIVVKSQKHYAQGWICKSTATEIDEDNVKFEYDPNTHTVISDLILDENTHAAPYATYISDKDITCYIGSGTIVSCKGYRAAYYYYRDSIRRKRRQLHEIDKLESEIINSLNKTIYLDLFSIFELFLSDLILCLIYSNKEVYNKAILSVSKKKNIDGDMATKMHTYYLGKVVYHQLDKVNLIFNQLLGLSLPDYTEFGKYLDIRNDIAHRCSYSKENRMRITTIKKEEVLGFMNMINHFVEELMNNIKEHFDISNK